MPLWAQLLLALLPQIPQTAEEIAGIFAPHAGTTTGMKVASTLGSLTQLAAGAAAFEAQHSAAVAAAAAPKPATPAS